MFPPQPRPAILSALLALVLYAGTLGGTYVYDDRYIVLADPRVGDTALWGEFWTRDYFNGGADNLYRPLVSMTYALQARLHGRGDGQAWAFHLLNWLLHAGASAAVAELARRVTRSPPTALLAGLLFAAHPVHVEAVANIVGRAELMCALGIFSAMILFMRPLTTPRAVAIWGCMLFAILSKEQGILLPLLLLALLPLRPRGGGDAGAPGALAPGDDPQRSGEVLPYAGPATPGRRRLGTPVLVLILLLAWTLAAYVYLRENTLGLKFWWDRGFLDATINPMIHSVGYHRWLLPLSLFGRYAALLVAPIQLLPDYGGEVIGARVRFNDPYLYLGAALALACVAAVVMALLRRAWIVFFCLAGFAIVYGMVSNIPTLIGTNFAERLMYIPSAFFCILAASAILRLRRGTALMIASVALILFSVRTVTYAQRWNHPRALFESAIAQEPKSIRLYLLLAEDYERAGEMAAARNVLERARAVAPDYYRVWQRSAYMALSAGEFDEATRFAERAFHLQPTREGGNLINQITQAKSQAATRPGSGEAVTR